MTPCKIDDRFATFLVKGQDPEMIAEAVAHAIEQLSILEMMGSIGFNPE